MSNAVNEAIEQITGGLTALAEALVGADGSGDGETDADSPWTEDELKALSREDLLTAAEAASVEVTKGQKGPTIIKAILAKQEEAASGDEPDNDDPADDEKAEKKKAKKKGKKDKAKGGKSKGRGKE